MYSALCIASPPQAKWKIKDVEPARLWAVEQPLHVKDLWWVPPGGWGQRLACGENMGLRGESNKHLSRDIPPGGVLIDSQCD